MLNWKANWQETRQRMIGWWEHKDLVVQTSTPFIEEPQYKGVEELKPAKDVLQFYTDGKWRAKYNHNRLSKNLYGMESLPIADIMIGPGSLALYLGSEPGLSYETVWYYPTCQDNPNPENLPTLKFMETKWWDYTVDLCREGMKMADGKYLVGIPDLVENVDVLASLRDAQTLMIDMVERPEWIVEKVMEINQVWFEAYDRIYELLKDEEGGSSWGAFGIWSPGKSAKLQCDAAAMFSPRMFKRFVVPGLKEQCVWLDYSMFHLDGPECICQLDNLLAIDELDAVEWTPGAANPGGADQRWHEMYRRTLDAGKSVQVIQIEPEEIIPLLDIFGGAGMHILSHCRTMEQYEQLQKDLEPYYVK